MVIKKTIRSIIELVPGAVSEILRELSKTVSLPEQDIMDLNLIIEEMITNGIQHGNQFNTAQTVQFTLEYDDVDTVTISVKDEGKGFNPENLPNIQEINERMNSTGRGLILLKKVAEEVKFNENGSEIHVRKKVHPRKK